MRVAVGRYLIIFLLNFAIFGHVQSATTPEYDWMITPVCECNANGFRLISNHLLTGFEGKFAGHFTKITACEEPCTLNYGLLPCTGYFYEPNNNGKCTLFHHGVNTNVQSSPNGTAMLYVKCDQVSLKECTASTGGNTVATTTLSSAPQINFTARTTATKDDPILLFSAGNAGKTIYQYDLSANRTLEISDNPFYVYAMDYWLKGSTIIWSMYDNWNVGKIYMCNLTKNLQFPKMIACDDNGNHSVLLEHNTSDVYGLAVDWIHGLLFWTDYYMYSVNVMDLNTKQRKVLFIADRPTSLAVDPSKGLIFWIDYNKELQFIKRASMDGNDRMTIVNSSRPYGIALDIFNERVYLADSITNTISSIDYNGNNWRTILHFDIEIEYQYSLAIFEEKLYWANIKKDGVYVMNKFNGTEVRKLANAIYPLTVRVYHSAAQPELPNKCDQHSCGDGAICLSKGNSFDNEGKPQPRIGLPYSCVCADGYTTGKEPNTCVLRT